MIKVLFDEFAAATDFLKCTMDRMQNNEVRGSNQEEEERRHKRTNRPERNEMVFESAGREGDCGRSDHHDS
jgi:hypothetical protein